METTPLTFPHLTHTTHKEQKMGYIHLLIPTNQESHQPTQKNWNKNCIQKQQYTGPPNQNNNQNKNTTTQ